MLRRLAATSTDNKPVYYEITDIKKEDHETKMGTCETNDKIKNNNSNTEKNKCRHTDLELAGYNKYIYHLFVLYIYLLF